MTHSTNLNFAYVSNLIKNGENAVECNFCKHMVDKLGVATF